MKGNPNPVLLASSSPIAPGNPKMMEFDNVTLRMILVHNSSWSAYPFAMTIGAFSRLATNVRASTIKNTFHENLRLIGKRIASIVPDTFHCQRNPQDRKALLATAAPSDNISPLSVRPLHFPDHQAKDQCNAHYSNCKIDPQLSWGDSHRTREAEETGQTRGWEPGQDYPNSGF